MPRQPQDAKEVRAVERVLYIPPVRTVFPERIALLTMAGRVFQGARASRVVLNRCVMKQIDARSKSIVHVRRVQRVVDSAGLIAPQSQEARRARIINEQPHGPFGEPQTREPGLPRWRRPPSTLKQESRSGRRPSTPNAATPSNASDTRLDQYEREVFIGKTPRTSPGAAAAASSKAPGSPGDRDRQGHGQIKRSSVLKAWYNG